MSSRPPAMSITQWVAVATITYAVSSRCSRQSTLSGVPALALMATAPTQATQAMCRLGIAAYSSAPAETTPVPQVSGG
jgi:hypothetical protein